MPKSNLKAIKLACYIGYIIQAIVINLSPILFTTLIDEFKFSYSNLSIYFFIFGKENWRFIVLFWCIIPIINFFIFLKTNLEFKQEDDEIHFLKLIKHPTFIIALIAIASGAAAELIINQWISIFIKKGLNLSILFSNLVGMCGFALMLGAGFAPWLLGFLTTKFTSNMFDIQSSLKFSLLIVTIFPIITLIT